MRFPNFLCCHTAITMTLPMSTTRWTELIDHGNTAALAKMVPTKPGHISQSRWTQNSSPVGQILDLQVIHGFHVSLLQKRVDIVFWIVLI